MGRGCVRPPKHDGGHGPGDQEADGNGPKKLAEMLTLQVGLVPGEDQAREPRCFELRHTPPYNLRFEMGNLAGPRNFLGEGGPAENGCTAEPA